MQKVDFWWLAVIGFIAYNFGRSSGLKQSADLLNQAAGGGTVTNPVTPSTQVTPTTTPSSQSNVPLAMRGASQGLGG
jgi:hypothetical protein